MTQPLIYSRSGSRVEQDGVIVIDDTPPTSQNSGEGRWQDRPRGWNAEVAADALIARPGFPGVYISPAPSAQHFATDDHLLLRYLDDAFS